MTSRKDIERALDDGTLAMRLSRIAVAPMSSDIRVALSVAGSTATGGSAPSAMGRRYRGRHGQSSRSAYW